jgi:hypothetical protein
MFCSSGAANLLLYVTPVDQCAASTTTIAHRSYPEHILPSRNLVASRRFRLWITGDDQSQTDWTKRFSEDGERYSIYFESCARMPRRTLRELAELGTTTRRRNPVMDLVTLDLPAGRKQPSCYRPPRDVGGREQSPRTSQQPYLGAGIDECVHS